MAEKVTKDSELNSLWEHEFFFSESTSHFPAHFSSNSATPKLLSQPFESQNFSEPDSSHTLNTPLCQSQSSPIFNMSQVTPIKRTFQVIEDFANVSERGPKRKANHDGIGYFLSSTMALSNYPTSSPSIRHSQPAPITPPSFPRQMIQPSNRPNPLLTLTPPPTIQQGAQPQIHQNHLLTPTPKGRVLLTPISRFRPQPSIGRRVGQPNPYTKKTRDTWSWIQPDSVTVPESQLYQQTGYDFTWPMLSHVRLAQAAKAPAARDEPEEEFQRATAPSAARAGNIFDGGRFGLSVPTMTTQKTNNLFANSSNSAKLITQSPPSYSNPTISYHNGHYYPMSVQDIVQARVQYNGTEHQSTLPVTTANLLPMLSAPLALGSSLQQEQQAQEGADTSAEKNISPTSAAFDQAFSAMVNEQAYEQPVPQFSAATDQGSLSHVTPVPQQQHHANPASRRNFDMSNDNVIDGTWFMMGFGDNFQSTASLDFTVDPSPVTSQVIDPALMANVWESLGSGMIQPAVISPSTKSTLATPTSDTVSPAGDDIFSAPLSRTTTSTSTPDNEAGTTTVSTPKSVMQQVAEPRRLPTVSSTLASPPFAGPTVAKSNPYTYLDGPKTIDSSTSPPDKYPMKHPDTRTNHPTNPFDEDEDGIWAGLQPLEENERYLHFDFAAQV